MKKKIYILLIIALISVLIVECSCDNKSKVGKTIKVNFDSIE